MIKRCIYFLPLFIFLAFALLKICNSSLYNYLVQEDGVVEYLQFFMFLSASLIFLKISFGYFKKDRFIFLIYLLLSLGLFFVSFEEISWGQRVAQFETPESIKRHNYQNEMTLHNIGIFHKILPYFYIAIGFLGASLWLLPNKVINSSKIFKNFIPDWFLMHYFSLTAIIYLVIVILDVKKMLTFISWGDQEVAELLLSVGLFIFATFSILKKKQKPQQKNQKLTLF